MIYLLTTSPYRTSLPDALRPTYGMQHSCECGSRGAGARCHHTLAPTGAHLTREQIVAIAEGRAVPVYGASVAEARAWCAREDVVGPTYGSFAAYGSAS